LVTFFDELWEKIQASWQRPERGVPQVAGEAERQNNFVASSDDAKTSGKRGPNIGTLEKVAQARLVEEWMAKEGTGSRKHACDLVGTTPPTLRKYYDDPCVIERVEELSQDEQFKEQFDYL